MNSNINLKKEFIIALRHPLSYGSFRNLIRILISYGGVDRQYLFRTIFIVLICFGGIPFRMIERILFGKKIEKLQIEYPPIFIIGHWRSGTTYLHNLMTQDPNFGYVSTQQAWSPEAFLLMSQPWIKNLLGKIVPNQRPMDKVKISISSPAEEEWAIGNMYYSPYHLIHFPRGAKEYFSKEYFSNLDEIKQKNILDTWKKIYLRTCKKATYAFNGKRLILKNPSNTGRIKKLLEMFPEAKFIHIYRNPYRVYASRKHSSKAFSLQMRLQNQSETQSEKNILEAYQKVMQLLFDNQALIPEENFYEIKYEDFVGNELAELEKIYQQFNLPEFDKAKTHFQEYLDSQANYKTNKYSLDDETIAKIYDAWKFTIDKWQYSPPQQVEGEEIAAKSNSPETED